MSGFTCGPAVYEYKGILFEFHSWIGPWPLRKDLNPKKYAGHKFWDMWEEWITLSNEERLACRINKGGCQRI
jgi:hypothetical protein